MILPLRIKYFWDSKKWILQGVSEMKKVFLGEIKRVKENKLGILTVLFLDIITDAAGRLGDCVHKRCAEGLRGTHSIQKNLKLGPQRQHITHILK